MKEAPPLPGQYPLVDYLKRRGYELGRHVPPDEPVSPRDQETLERTRFLVAPRADADRVLGDLVEAFTVYEDGITSDDLERLVNALEAIKARIDGEYDLPALAAVGPLGNKDADILRIINEVLG